jgi:predicted dienelactone hydrolase
VRFIGAMLFVAGLVATQVAEVHDDTRQGELRLPSPGGQSAVGRTTYYWTDLSRPEQLSTKDGAHREVVVFVWYPAAKAQKATKPSPYFPDFKAARAGISDADFQDLFRPADKKVQEKGLPLTHAIEAASMPHANTKYPVLIFSHGWGLQTPVYTAALEDLASDGYIVAAIDHPYDTTVTVFPDGRIARFAQDKFDAAVKKPHGYIDYAYERIEVMARDVRFVIDQLSRYNNPQPGVPFAGHLDLNRLGAFGHSIGGMTSARACQIDNRIRACLDEDSIDDIGSPFSVISPGSIPKQPFLLFIASSSDIFSEKALHPSNEDLSKQKLSRAQYDEMIATQQRKQNELLGDISGGAYRVMLFDLPGIMHRSFCDLPLLADDEDTAQSEQALHNFQIIQEYIRGFFDKYLKADSHTVLDRAAPPDPQVRIDRFGIATKAEKAAPQGLQAN